MKASPHCIVGHRHGPRLGHVLLCTDALRHHALYVGAWYMNSFLEILSTQLLMLRIVIVLLLQSSN
jgi:hypothetical protein